MKLFNMFIFGLALSSIANTAHAEVSFKMDLVPALKKNCAICHLTGQEAGNLALHPRAAYKSLTAKQSIEAKNMLLVSPGKAEDSYLIHKLQGTHLDVGGTGNRMPFGNASLPPEIINDFVQWVNEGAKNN